MISAVIIEDDLQAIELLKTLIREHCGELVNLVGYAQTVKEAMALIQDKQPELIYLDIELNHEHAFGLLDSLDTIDFKIIFISAFDAYAVKAFRYSAVDYLLKPVSISELQEATRKAIRQGSGPAGNKAVLEAIAQLKNNLGISKIGVPVLNGIVFIDITEIIKVEANRSYSTVYLNGGKKLTVIKSLKDIERILPDTSFVRVHNSWIVNVRYLKKYYRGKNSYMEMMDGSTVQVSLRKKKSFLDLLNE